MRHNFKRPLCRWTNDKNTSGSAATLTARFVECDVFNYTFRTRIYAFKTGEQFGKFLFSALQTALVSFQRHLTHFGIHQTANSQHQILLPFHRPTWHYQWSSSSAFFVLLQLIWLFAFTSCMTKSSHDSLTLVSKQDVAKRVKPIVLAPSTAAKQGKSLKNIADIISIRC
ncbi:hypothetical protein PRNP1_004555 [Phytophthora ramorum]